MTAVVIMHNDRGISQKAGKIGGLLAGTAVLAAMVLASLFIGIAPVRLSTALEVLHGYDESIAEHIILRDYRLPRTLLSLLCGAAFGVSGALIQAATRNPLADPGILGVNAGAAFFVTITIAVFGLRSIDTYIWAALAGATIVTLAVYALGSATRQGSTPLRLVLAGVALSSVLGGIGSAITLLDPQAFDAMRMWALGSVAGRGMNVVVTATPFIGLGLLISLLIARPLNMILLGNDLARSLGASVQRIRLLTVLAVTLLAGAATAAVGPIGFIGLMVPHVVRKIAGPDQRWIIVLTMVFAPVLLLAADIVGRLVLFPGELEAGIVTAFVGAPVLILLARRKKMNGL